MLSWSFELWLIFCLIAGSAVVALLRVVSATIADERRIATLHKQVSELRAEYNKRIKEMKIRRGLIVEEDCDVEIVG